MILGYRNVWYLSSKCKVFNSISNNSNGKFKHPQNIRYQPGRAWNAAYSEHTGWVNLVRNLKANRRESFLKPPAQEVCCTLHRKFWLFIIRKHMLWFYQGMYKLLWKCSTELAQPLLTESVMALSLFGVFSNRIKVNTVTMKINWDKWK